MRDLVNKLFVLLLFLQTMGVVAGLTSPDWSGTSTDVVETSVHLPVLIAQGLIYAFFAFLILCKARKIGTALSTIYPLLLLISFCALSFIWSQNPSLSLRRAIVLFATTLVGVAVGSEFAPDALGRLFAGASLIHIAMCAVFAVVAPRFIIADHSLRGLAGHKNIFGIEMGLAMAAFMLTPFRRWSALRWPLALSAFILLVLSRSAGSLTATMAGIVCIPLYHIIRLRGIQKIPVFLLITVVIGFVGVLMVTNASSLPLLVSKDMTLTGRTGLWSLLEIAIQRRPLFGYGFDAFWQGLQGESLNVIQGVGWLVPTAHNGYLELMIGEGLIGMLLFIPVLGQMLRRSVRFLAEGKGSSRYWPVTFVVIWLVYNFAESALISRSDVPYLLFVSITTSLGLHASSARVKAGFYLSKPSRFNLDFVRAIPDLVPNR